MKHLITLCALVSMCLMSFTTVAQTLTNKERRHINTKALSVIEDYERYATLYDEDAEYAFINLFDNEHTMVVCDIMGFAGYLEKIPLSEYVDALRRDAATVTMEVKNVRKGEMTYDGEEWVIPIIFQKSISYIDKNDYVFSTDAFYGKDLEMQMTIHYNPESDICRIISLSGSIDSDIAFPEGRFVMLNKADVNNVPEKYQKYIPELEVNGAVISYNQFDQAILPSGEPSVKDIDVLVFQDTLLKGPNYDVMKFDFKQRKTRLKLHYGIAPFEAYKLLENNNMGDSSKAMEAGVDIGFTWRAGKTGKMGFFLGAGLSMSELSLSLTTQPPLSYNYKTSVQDKSSGLFKDLKLTYDLRSASEALKFMDLYVPLYFEIEHKVGKHLLISWNLGVKGYYNFSAKLQPYMVDGTLKIEDNVTSEVSNKPIEGPFTKYISPSSYNKRMFDVSLIGNIGFDINLLKRKVYLSVKGGYEYGLLPSYIGNGNKYFVYEHIFPVVYDPIKGMIVPTHSLISNISLRRQAIWLETGLKFKI